MHSIIRLNLRDSNDQNAFYLVLEIFWAAILLAASTFNGAFVIRLGASNYALGLLTSIPALMAAVVSIPAGQFLQARSRRKLWVIGSLQLNRLVYLLLALVPWLPVTQAAQGLWAVGIIVILSIPAHFFNVGFIPMLADVIPEERRANVFAARNIIYNIAFSLTVLLFGQLLTHLSFPLNYQVMYLIAFGGALLSQYFLLKVDVPDSMTPSKGQRKSLGEYCQTIRQILKEHRSFFGLTRNTLLHGFGVWTALPLYILYFVKDLKATDAWIGLQGTVASLATVIGYAFWRWVIRQWGEQKTLKITILFIGLYPILAGLIPNLTFILVAIGVNGFMASGVNLSHITMLLKVTPPNNRPGYTAIYMTIMNIGAFLCPLIGVYIADHLGFNLALILCGALIILGSSTFTFWPVLPQAPVHKAILPEQ